MSGKPDRKTSLSHNPMGPTTPKKAAPTSNKAPTSGSKKDPERKSDSLVRTGSPPPKDGKPITDEASNVTILESTMPSELARPPSVNGCTRKTAEPSNETPVISSESSKPTSAPSVGTRSLKPFWSDKAKTQDSVVTSNWKPESKIPLARISYELKNLPKLYVVEVELTTKNDKGGHDTVQSKKLKYKAIQEMLDSSALADIKPAIAINLDGRKADTDDKANPWITNLIVPMVSQVQPIPVFGKMSKDYVKLSKIGKELSKSELAARKNDSVFDTKPIYYRILGAGKSLRPDADSYIRSLDIVFRTYASRGINTTSQYGLDAEYCNPLTTPKDMDTDVPPGFEVMTRHRPIFEKQDASNLKIHFDFDLATVIPSDANLAEVVDKYLEGFAKDLHFKRRTTTDTVREIFRGLRVRSSKVQARQLGGAVEEKDSEFSTSPEQQSSLRPTIKSSDISVIRDIRSISEVGQVFDREEEKYRSIKDIVGAASKDHEHLPLADIGRNRPYWVRLETLTAKPHQSIRTTDQSSRKLRDFVTKSDNGVKQAEQIVNDARIRIKRVAKGVFKFDQLSIERIPFIATSTNDNASEPKTTRSAVDKQVKARLAIVYVTSHGSASTRGSFLQDVKNVLQDDHQEILRFNNQIVDVRVSSAQDIIRQAEVEESPLHTTVSGDTRETEPEVILGIIDDHGLDKVKHQEIKAELKRFGDRKAGAVTLCVSKGDVDKFLRRPDGALFPPNVLRKMRFMLGNANWVTEELNVKGLGQDCMIVGAHIAHPGSNSTEFCPSVAAVVASVQPKPVVYPGSMRLQPNYPGSKKTKSDNSIHKRTHAHGILGLQDMMQERFKAWRNNNTGAPAVVFYRKSYDIEDTDVYAQEVQDIEKAYATVFDIPLALTYIVLTKNVRQHVRHKEDPNSSEPPLTFTSLVPTGNGSYKSVAESPEARYQYHVPYNSTGLSRDALAKLTNDLNLTSQLGPRTTIALPLRYADKLSHRVFDYFRFWSHKVVSNIPTIARQTPYDWESLPIEQRGTEFKDYAQQYLENDSLKTFWAKRDPSQVRTGVKGTTLRPWRPSLDNKMFYL